MDLILSSYFLSFWSSSLDLHSCSNRWRYGSVYVLLAGAFLAGGFGCCDLCEEYISGYLDPCQSAL